MGQKTRAHLIVSGRVQGVSFRAETQKAANRIGVYGWVRNRRDGKVEAVVEGASDDVAAMLGWCQSGSPASRVEKVDVTRQDFRGEFDAFRVRY
jgi:acylphosphatase